MTDTLTLWLGERLLSGSLQGAVVIMAVWLACRLLPKMPAAAQSALWWLVALKLVLTFAPAPTLPVALLPASFDRQIERVLLQPLPPTPLVTSIDPWLMAAVLFWFAVLLLQVGRLIRAHRLLVGIVRRSTVWRDEETGELARRLGLTRVPQVRLSDEIDTPQVCGLRKPVVLVPAAMMGAFTPEERSMTLCHELMHVRRCDLALGWVPACAERLFFFHPLVRLAAREYITAREAACDAAAVRALGVSVTDYGRMLIRLGIGNAGSALAAGGSPFSASSLKRRLNMLQRHETSDFSRRWRWAITGLAAVVIPIQLVARTPQAQDTVTEKVVEIRSKLIAAEQQLNAVEQERVGVPGGVEGGVPGGVVGGVVGAVENQKADDIKGHAVEMIKMIQATAERAKLEAARDRQTLMSSFINDQLREMNHQQEILIQQMQDIAKRQRELAAQQRQLTEEIERLRRATPRP